MLLEGTGDTGCGSMPMCSVLRNEGDAAGTDDENPKGSQDGEYVGGVALDAFLEWQRVNPVFVPRARCRCGCAIEHRRMMMMTISTLTVVGGEERTRRRS